MPKKTKKRHAMISDYIVKYYITLVRIDTLYVLLFYENLWYGNIVTEPLFWMAV